MAATNPIRQVYAASATGAQEPLSIDWRDQVPSGYSFEVQFNAGASGSVTIQSTLDDINDSTITPDWITETVAITSDTRGIIAHPVTAVRVNIGSLAGGTLTFKLLGGSLIGDVTGLVIPGGGGGPSSNVNLVATGGNTLAVDDAPAGTTAPVPVGGIYNTAFPIYTNLDRTQLQTNINGHVLIAAPSNLNSDAVTNANAFRDLSGTQRPLAVGNWVSNGTTWDRQRGTTLGTYAIGPDADDAAASAGANPVPVGGIYQTVLPTYTTGDRSQLQTDPRGALRSAMTGVSAAGSDGFASNIIYPYQAGSQTGAALLGVSPLAFNGTTYDRIRNTGPAATTGGALLVQEGPYVAGRVTADGQIKATAGFIHTISISPNGAVVAGVLTIYDSATEAGTIIAQFSLPVTFFTPFSVILDVATTNGIYVGFDATLANVSCTVSYR